MGTVHRPVMLDEVLEYVTPAAGVDDVSLIIDATVGEGGHAGALLERYGNASLVGIDADGEILERAAVNLQRFGHRVRLVRGWYDKVLKKMIAEQRESVDIIFLDLGVSMFHFIESGRGFSFKREEKLDMRLDLESKLTAYEVVNRYSQSELERLIREYGEERFARRIAERIVREREKRNIETSKDLEEIVWRAVPKNYRYRRINPSTKTFQAIRIEVNDELERLKRALYYSGLLLKKGGVIGVISFHSLEDRIVKRYFKTLEDAFLSGVEKPILLNRETSGIGYVNENIGFEALVKKPVVPKHDEVESNPASRSAKLRVYRKV